MEGFFHNNFLNEYKKHMNKLLTSFTKKDVFLLLSLRGQMLMISLLTVLSLRDR